jgi:hypothetical protein
MTTHDRERAEELAHGGLVSREGNIVSLGDGSQWWLIDQPWARNEADTLIPRDRTMTMTSPTRGNLT